MGGGDRFAHAYWQKLQRRAPKLDGSGAAQTNGPTLIIAVWVQPTEAGPQIFAAGRAERGAWVWLVRVFSGSGELSNGGEREREREREAGKLKYVRKGGRESGRREDLQNEEITCSMGQSNWHPVRMMKPSRNNSEPCEFNLGTQNFGGKNQQWNLDHPTSFHYL